MSSSAKIGIVMDPVAHINPQRDTTLAMMLAAQDMGASLHYMVQDDLFIKDGKAYGKARPLRVFGDAARWFEESAAQTLPLGAFDVILMRKDPPVDKRFIHTCAILAQAQRDGARVVNDPAALMLYNEKFLATHFPQFCAPYIITSSHDELRAFRVEHGAIVIKPLDAMGGQGVFMVAEDDMNFDVIADVQTHGGTYPVIAQAFLPQIAEGDRRIVVFFGKPIAHALVRKPRKGSIRSNLAAGGSFTVRPMNAREIEIAETVGARLMAEGVVFAGLDVIGDYLTEVNITSPTGLRQLSQETGVDLPRTLMEKILSGAC